MSLSWAYHVSRMQGVDTGHEELIKLLEDNYQNWKRHCLRKRESKTRRQLVDKIERYEEMVQFNRYMYEV